MNPKKPLPGMIREAPVADRGSQTVSATDAARNFSELLNRVHYRGETFVIERSGTAVGQLGPAAPGPFSLSDLVSLLRSLPVVDAGFFDDVEAAAKGQPPLPEISWDS